MRNTGQSPPGGTSGADIKAEQAWDITTGNSNVLIAILDSGIPLRASDLGLSHPDLNDANKVMLRSDYTGDGQSVRDRNGHGTHVAGIAAAMTNNGEGIAGVAWNSRIMVYQVFDSTGGGDWPYFRNAVRDAVDYQRNNPGVKVVINFSGAGPFASADAEDAVSYANQHNVPVVVAAGNYHPTRNPNTLVMWPARYSTSYSNVIAIAATDQNDNRASYSGRGSALNVSAPGGFGGTVNADDIFSTTPDYPFYWESQGVGRTYGYMAGTSMAAPLVAGTAALMLSVNSSLTPSQIRSTLQLSADDKGTAGFDTLYGYGRINALKATARSFVLANPQYTFATGTTPVSLQASNVQMDFLARPLPDLAIGTYWCDRYVAQVTVGGFSQAPIGWYLSEAGYSFANPNYATRWIGTSTTSSSITMQTVFYYIKYNLIGQQINRWAPFDPNSSPREYAVLGIPCNFSVSISGPSVAPCATGTWTANVTGCYPPFNYQWYHMWDCGGGAITTTSTQSGKIQPMRPCDSWTAVGTNSSTLQMYWCGGNGYLRVDVTDARGTLVSAQYYVQGAGGGGAVLAKASGEHSEAEVTKQLPLEYSIGSYPNPFNPATVVSYQLPVGGTVKLSVFDVLGREVETLVNGEKAAGYYTAAFDASQVRSGVYFARISVTSNEGKPFVQTIKMLLTK